MKVFGSITVFTVAAIGFAVGQIVEQAPPLDRTFGKQAPVARQLADKPPVDRQDDPANAEMILGEIQASLEPASCGPAPSWLNDPWVSVPARESAKRWALGCVNLPPQPEGAKRRDSRNLGPTFSRSL